MLNAVREWVGQAKHICVLTGAGISAESGVPTFREAQTGYWAQFKPEDMASEAGFRSHPERVWQWYEHRRKLVAAVQPNAAHHALAQWGKKHPSKLDLITQNVDGLHQRAGSDQVISLHGNLFSDKWLEPAHSCCSQALAMQQFTEGHPPCCPGCGNMRRPDVVWFGERLPELALAQAEAAANQCDLMLVIGTAGVVYPAAGLVFQAHERGARIVIINTTSTELDVLASTVLIGPASETLPQLLSD